MPRGARLGHVAMTCSVLALFLEPVAVGIAVRGDTGDATAGGIGLVLLAATLLSLTALVLGVVSFLRLRGAPDKVRLPAVMALVLGAFGMLSALGVGVLSFLIASNGGWIYMN